MGAGKCSADAPPVDGVDPWNRTVLQFLSRVLRQGFVRDLWDDVLCPVLLQLVALVTV